MKYLGWLLALIGLFALLAFAAGYAFLETVPMALKVIGGSGAALIGLWVFLDWGSLSDLGRDQTVGRSATAGFATLLVAGIAVTADVLAHRYDDYIDLTETKKFTLSPQSVDVVKKLDRDVKVLAFFSRGSPEEQNFRELMKMYQQNSTLLAVEYHDPYSDPQLTQQYKIMSPTGTVIVKVGDGEQRLESKFDEEAFTNALVRSTSAETHKVCVVTGHGELDKDDVSSPAGLGFAMTKLEGQNYTVSALNLAEAAPTPETCQVLILASPRQDLLPAELDRIAAYVAAGGGFIAMLDPLQADGTAADMARYGVSVGNDVVIDPDPNRQVSQGDPSFILLDSSSVEPHELTDKLRGNSVLRLVRSVSKGADVPGLTVQEILHTSDQAWGETTLSDPSIPAQPDPGKDKMGKVPLAAVVEVTDPAGIRTATAPAAAAPAVPGMALPTPTATSDLPKKAGGRVVVFGDADFADNQMIASGVNLDLVLNTVAWLANEKDQISIRPNEAAKNKLDLGTFGMFISGAVALIVVPGLAIMGAIGTWLMRRRL